MDTEMRARVARLDADIDELCALGAWLVAALQDWERLLLAHPAGGAGKVGAVRRARLHRRRVARGRRPLRHRGR